MRGISEREQSNGTHSNGETVTNLVMFNRKVEKGEGAISGFWRVATEKPLSDTIGIYFL